MCKPEASVIIPTYNRAKILKKNLTALNKQTFPKEKFEIIVVDDGSTDDTEKAVRKFSRENKIKTLYLKQKHKNIAAARNLALKKAKGKYIIFLNNDIIPSEKLVEEHLKTQLKHANKKIAVLGKVEYYPGKKPNVFMKFLEEKNYWLNFPAIENKKILSWGYFWTCNLSIKKEILGKEKFDEKLIWHEDTELGHKLYKKGLKIIYNKKAIGFHLHEMTFRKWEKNQKNEIPSMLQLYIKIFGKENLIKKINGLYSGGKPENCAEKTILRQMHIWHLAIELLKKEKMENDLEDTIGLFRKKMDLLEKQKVANKKTDKEKLFALIEIAANLVILNELLRCYNKLMI